MKHITFLLFSLLIVHHSVAQTGKITGTVIDAKTQSPLPFANVYINNTTIGVTTDTLGKFTLPALPAGSAEIVFSFIGYISQQLKVVVKESGNTPLAIQLAPDSQQLSEVAIKAGRDKNWEKQLKRFESVFFGNTSNCKILNAWALDFTETGTTMAAKATIPLEIQNNDLGYKLFFQLKKFSFSASEFSIVGNIRFVEMETTEKSVAADWMKNRETAYRSSAKFLMKSILDRSASKNGFVLYRDKVKGTPRSDNFSREIQHNLTPYDTTSIVAQLSGTNEFRIGIKEKMEIHNKLQYIKNRFYTDISYPVSWLETRGGYVMVNATGTILNPTDVAVSGNMADARVAGMLPLDYKPGTFIVAQSAEAILAKKLQEKIYIHADRPYYYPRETIWLSAYMNYRTPAMADSLSKVMYVDLIDAGKNVVSKLVLPIDSGRAAGSIRISAEIKPGKYLIRAYTEWLKNYGIDYFFYKPIRILDVTQGADIIASKPIPDAFLKVKFDKEDYKTRNKVVLNLSLDSTRLSHLTKGSLSIAVFDETQIIPLQEELTIKSVFDLLEAPRETAAGLRYPIEKGLTLNGQYQDKKGKGKKARLTLLPEDMSGIFPVSTETNGEFTVRNMLFSDSTKFVVQPSDGKVIVAKRETPFLPEKLPELDLKIKSLATPHTSFTMDTMRATLLDEFKVVGKETLKTENQYAKPDFYIKAENMGNFASAGEVIAAKIPGLKLIFDSNNWFLVWARGDISSKEGRPPEPNLYIDNVMVTGETVGNRLFQINPSMIDHIEVNGMITANQGANGANGLINVFTRKTNEVNSKSLSIFKAKGFDRRIPFPSPDYEITNTGSQDNRTTIYWNPKVEIQSPKIPVELSFYTSDQAGKYRVVVEGMTNRGNLIHSESVIVVKD